MVLALVLLPALSDSLGGIAPDGSGDQGLMLSLVLTLGKVVLFVALMFGVGTRIIPWLLARVEGTGSRELFLLAVLAIALGSRTAQLSSSTSPSPSAPSWPAWW